MQTLLRVLTFGLLALAAVVALVSAKLQDADPWEDGSRGPRLDKWQGVFRLGALKLQIAMHVSRPRGRIGAGRNEAGRTSSPGLNGANN